ncbi:hypothetical protein CsatB_023119 [Cannabis sativa]
MVLSKNCNFWFVGLSLGAKRGAIGQLTPLPNGQTLLALQARSCLPIFRVLQKLEGCVLLASWLEPN